MSNLKYKCSAFLVDLGAQTSSELNLDARKILLSNAVQLVCENRGVDMVKTRVANIVQCLSESDWSCFTCEFFYWYEHATEERRSCMVEFARRSGYDPSWRWNYPDIGEVWASVDSAHVVVESETDGNTYRKLEVLKCMKNIINKEKKQDS
jgi:hypothetical protein